MADQVDERDSPGIVMQMPITAPILQLVKYEPIKKYKYVGDWNKDSRMKKS